MNFVVIFFGGEEVDVLLFNDDVNQVFIDGFFGLDVMIDFLFIFYKSMIVFLLYCFIKIMLDFILN